jgi:molybdopterin biosynthesis enzyme
MIPLAEAQQYVLSGCAPLDTAPTAIADSLGLVTAEPIMCGENIPPFDNTAVDGYAVIAADVAATPVELEVIGSIAAGEAPSVPLRPGTAIRIMTGAPLPEGADAVVMVENTESNDDRSVTINAPVSAGAAVRRAGEDMQPGQEVFGAGTLLQPGHLGVLATLGMETIATHRRPRSALSPPAMSSSRVRRN